MSDFNLISYHSIRAPRSDEVENHSDRRMQRLDHMGYELVNCSRVSLWEQAQIKAWAEEQSGDVYVSNLQECNYDFCNHEDVSYTITQEWCNIVGFYPYQRESFEAMIEALPKREHIVIFPADDIDIKSYEAAAKEMSKRANVGVIHMTQRDGPNSFLFATFADKEDAVEFKMMA